MCSSRTLPPIMEGMVVARRFHCDPAAVPIQCSSVEWSRLLEWGMERAAVILCLDCQELFLLLIWASSLLHFLVLFLYQGMITLSTREFSCTCLVYHYHNIFLFLDLGLILFTTITTSACVWIWVVFQQEHDRFTFIELEQGEKAEENIVIGENQSGMDGLCDADSCTSVPIFRVCVRVVNKVVHNGD